MNSNLKQVNKLKINPKRKKKSERKKKVEKSAKPKFYYNVIKVSRVSKVTKGGKKLSFRVSVVMGNENGKVGVGVGKANDVVDAIIKGKADAEKNLIEFALTKSLSIGHRISGHFGACKIIMRPSIEGSGVIAGGATRIVLKSAGVKNIIAKQLGSNNLLNNARASICALKTLTSTKRKY